MYHGAIESRANRAWKYGLDPEAKRNFPWAEKGVYLTTNPDVAKHFGGAGNEPEDAQGRSMRQMSGREEVIIITVSTKGLDPKKFKPDPRVPNSFIYLGIIPANNIVDWNKSDDNT